MPHGDIGKLQLQLHDIMWRRQVNNSDAPSAVTTYATFGTYQQIAMNVCGSEGYALVWFIYGTPLKIKGLNSDNLTEADAHFAKFVAKGGPKVRVVIFSSPWQLYKYVKVAAHSGGERLSWFDRHILKISKEILDRRRAFEEACKANGDKKGELYFTTTRCIRRATRYDSDVLEIGVVCPTEKIKYCFQTPFESEEFDPEGDYDRAIKFFRLRRNCMGVPGATHYFTLVDPILARRKAEFEDKWYFKNPVKLKQLYKNRIWVWSFFWVGRRVLKWWRLLLPSHKRETGIDKYLRFGRNILVLGTIFYVIMERAEVAQFISHLANGIIDSVVALFRQALGWSHST